MALLRIFFLVILSFPMYCFSQQLVSLEGEVYSNSGDLINEGTVILKSLVTGAMYVREIDEGIFLFSKLPLETYVVTIKVKDSKLYEEIFVLNKKKQVKIILDKVNVALKEVVISTKKSTFKQNGANVLAVVKGSFLENEASLKDILIKMPKVQVDPVTEQITLLGEGIPLLYLDNQLISQEELSSLSVDEILSVELIENPVAKYEANGNKVLLFKTRKQKQNGSSATLSESISRKRRFSNLLNGAFNYKTRTTSFRVNTAYNQLQIWEGNKSVSSVDGGSLFSRHHTKGTTKRAQFIVGFNGSLKINETDYVTITTLNKLQTEPFKLFSNTNHSTNSIKQTINSINDQNGFRRFTTSKLSYFNEFTENKNLFLGIQSTYFKTQINSQIFSDVNKKTLDLFQNRLFEFEVDAFGVKLDYEDKENDLFNYLLGGQISKNTNHSFFKIDKQKDIESKYKEERHAIYFQISKSYSKWYIDIGARLENTITLNNDLKKSRIGYFPNVQVKYTINDQDYFKLDYKKSIQRLNFSNFNVGNVFIHPFLEFVNNPNLIPSHLNNFNAEIQLFNFNTKLSYYHRLNPVFFGSSFNDKNQKIVYSSFNISKQQEVFLDIRKVFKYKFWDTFSLFSIRASQIIDDWVFKQFYWYTNHDFKLNSRIALNLNLWGTSRSKEYIFITKPQLSINAGINLKPSKKWTFAVRFNDILKQTDYQNSSRLNDFSSNTAFFSDNQGVNFTIKYFFGSLKKLDTLKSKEVDDNLKRIN